MPCAKTTAQTCLPTCTILREFIHWIQSRTKSNEHDVKSLGWCVLSARHPQFTGLSSFMYRWTHVCSSLPIMQRTGYITYQWLLSDKAPVWLVTCQPKNAWSRKFSFFILRAILFSRRAPWCLFFCWQQTWPFWTPLSFCIALPRRHSPMHDYPQFMSQTCCVQSVEHSGLALSQPPLG